MKGHHTVFYLTVLLALTCQAPPALAAHGPNREPLQVLQPTPGLNADKVALGKRLFFDARLSANDSLSCASCHDLSSNGTDNRRFSIGMNNASLGINTPTVFNSIHNAPMFWDGRALDAAAQIDFVVKAPLEFNTSWPAIIQKLAQDRSYVGAFKAIYGQGPRQDNITDALVEFEKSLVATGSRFDQYLQGRDDALNEEEKKGYRLFKSYGCVACHQGQNVGGNMFQKLGTFRDYFAGRKNLSRADLGRFNVTGKEEDRHVFRVPSLRLVVYTAPYFHDGSARTLEDAIEVMAQYQLGRKIPPADVQAIIAFLHTLPGKYQGRDLHSGKLQGQQQ